MYRKEKENSKCNRRIERERERQRDRENKKYIQRKRKRKRTVTIYKEIETRKKIANKLRSFTFKKNCAKPIVL